MIDIELGNFEEFPEIHQFSGTGKNHLNRVDGELFLGGQHKSLGNFKDKIPKIPQIAK